MINLIAATLFILGNTILGLSKSDDDFEKIAQGKDNCQQVRFDSTLGAATIAKMDRDWNGFSWNGSNLVYRGTVERLPVVSTTITANPAWTAWHTATNSYPEAAAFLATVEPAKTISVTSTNWIPAK